MTHENSETSKARPWILGAITLIGLCALAFVLLAERSTARASATVQPEMAELFGADAACRLSAGEAPQHRAAIAARAAGAKRERAPFVPQDGVEAALLLAEASQCSRQAGEEGRAVELEAQASRLRTEIWQSLQGQRLRLELALSESRWGDALEDVRAQRAWFGQATTPYAAWLRKQEAQLEARLSRRRS
jgi:hypothetical protein